MTSDEEIKKALELLEELVEPEPCYFDHNHSCQAHGYFFLDQGEMCPVEESKRFLQKHKED